MLLKLFRHDFRALSRAQVPVLIAVAAAAVLGFFNMLVLAGTGSGQFVYEGSAGHTLLLSTSIGGTLLVSTALAAALSVLSVLIFVRFYRSMVTDEAYLTFTLPVTAGQLIGAKFLASAVWFLIGGIAILLAGSLMLSGAFLAGGADFREAMSYMWDDMLTVVRENPRTILLLCLFALASAVRWYFQITGAILFGASIVRKNKALAAVGMIFAANFAVNLITAFLPVVGPGSLFLLAFTGSDFVDAYSPDLWLGIQTVVAVLLAALFWWMSVRIAKKSVNIE